MIENVMLGLLPIDAIDDAENRRDQHAVAGRWPFVQHVGRETGFALSFVAVENV